MKKFLTSVLIILTVNIFAIDGLDALKQEYQALLDKKYILLPHNGNYLIPFSYNFKPNNEAYGVLTSASEFQGRGDYNKSLETEFQISFMVLTNRNVLNSSFNLFMGYTHQSWWQVYNANWSRPFRETNYAPEIFARKLLSTPRSFIGGKVIAYDIGLIHQSNGQIQELSRSWNRAFLRTAIVYGNTFLKTTLWYRIPESSLKDENKDIYKYLGYGEIEIDQVWSNNRVQLKIIPGTKFQGVELTYSYPWHEGIRYFVKLGYGYGLNLIDYRNEGQKIGVGFVLSDLLSR